MPTFESRRSTPHRRRAIAALPLAATLALACLSWPAGERSAPSDGDWPNFGRDGRDAVVYLRHIKHIVEDPRRLLLSL